MESLTNMNRQAMILELIKNTFRGRQDVVAKAWRSPEGQAKGYAPICQNRGSEVCQINSGRKNPCKNCRHKKYAPLSTELLLEHLNGKLILGVYPLLLDNTCFFIAGDFDNHSGEQDPFIMDPKI